MTTCRLPQFAKPPELMTTGDLVREIEALLAQRKITHKELLGLRVTEKRLSVLIAKYDLMLLAVTDALYPPHFEKENQK